MKFTLPCSISICHVPNAPFRPNTAELPKCIFGDRNNHPPVIRTTQKHEIEERRERKEQVFASSSVSFEQFFSSSSSPKKLACRTDIVCQY